MRGWWLAAAMALGGVAGVASCTDGATIQEACTVVCACTEALPSARAQCEAQCVTELQVPQACLECIVGVEDCGRLESTCNAECD